MNNITVHTSFYPIAEAESSLKIFSYFSVLQHLISLWPVAFPSILFLVRAMRIYLGLLESSVPPHFIWKLNCSVQMFSIIVVLSISIV